MSILNTIKFIIKHPLNKGRKLSSIIRFAKWQIGSRLVPGEIVHDWVNGSKFILRAGETGLTGNIYTGLHEFQDMGYLLHVLRDDDLFIDVGANVGSYTVLACSAIGARGYAFEPIPRTFERLVENIRINNLEDSVQCINMGVGERNGSITFTSDLDTMNHVLVSDGGGRNVVEIDTVTLDATLKGEAPTLLKIDVEGFEAPVLKGAPETLSNPSLHSVIMELNGSGERYGIDESDIMKLMLDYGFLTYSYDPLERVLVNLNGKNQSSGNTLFIRNLSFVQDRLKVSPKINIYGEQF